MSLPMRLRQLGNLLRALDLIARPQGALIADLRRTLQVDRATVYRNIRLLESLGFPLYSEKVVDGPEVRYRLEEGYVRKLPNLSIPDLRLTLGEAILLQMLRGRTGPLRETELARRMDLLFNKLATILPADIQSRLDRLAGLFIPGERAGRKSYGKEEVIDVLAGAILETKTCVVSYHSFQAGAEKKFRVDPLHLFEHRGGLYAFVRVPRFGDIRTLAVERIQEVTTTDDHFEYPEDFDPDKLLESAFNLIFEEPTTVRIRFSAASAPYVRERSWAANQTIADEPGGGLTLEMTTSGIDDVRAWVLSFGSGAEVLAPDVLRSSVLEELRAAAQLYEVSG